MSKVVEMLKEKGIAERIQRNVDRSVALFGKDVPQEEIDKSVRIILDFELHRNPELSDAFAEYALDLAMDSVVKELESNTILKLQKICLTLIKQYVRQLTGWQR